MYREISYGVILKLCETHLKGTLFSSFGLFVLFITQIRMDALTSVYIDISGTSKKNIVTGRIETYFENRYHKDPLK